MVRQHFYEAEYGLSKQKQDALVEAGYGKLVCVWGMIIGGSPTFPDSTLLYAANVAAEFLDPDQTGKPKNEAIRKAFSSEGGALLGGGIDQETESKICDNVRNWYCYSFQAWKYNEEYGQVPDTEYYDGVKRIINEEIFHMYTHSLAKVYPEQIGDSDFTTSVSCREMARLQCLKPGWHHEENTCPNGNPDPSGVAPSSPLQGTCNDASCDCIEFFNQAVLGLIGQEPGWRSSNMPTSQAGFEQMLSTEFKEMVANPLYGLPQRPFTGTYTATATDTATNTATTATDTTTATTTATATNSKSLINALANLEMKPPFKSVSHFFHVFSEAFDIWINKSRASGGEFLN